MYRYGQNRHYQSPLQAASQHQYPYEYPTYTQTSRPYAVNPYVDSNLYYDDPYCNPDPYYDYYTQDYYNESRRPNDPQTYGYSQMVQSGSTYALDPSFGYSYDNFSNNNNSHYQQQHYGHRSSMQSHARSLLPEQIRWFFRDSDKKPWQAFSGYDSLRIEARFRRIYHVENAEKFFNQQTKDIPDVSLFDEGPPLVVREGLFEVDVGRKKCYAVYWEDENAGSEICRGSWFYSNMQPVEEHYAAYIEFEHLKVLSSNLRHPQNVRQSTGGSFHVYNFDSFTVEWITENDVRLHSEAISSKLVRRLFKSGVGGTRLIRGHTLLASIEDSPPIITDLVFVIHGIGQKLDNTSIVRNCMELGSRCDILATKMKSSKLMHHQKSSSTSTPGIAHSQHPIRHPLFLPVQWYDSPSNPVEWRSSMVLDKGLLESCTPDQARSLRNLVNLTAMDIMYYTSPLHHSEMMSSLVLRLNVLFAKFIQRNPNFVVDGGRVSAVAHSLGSAVMYDIVSGFASAGRYQTVGSGFHFLQRIRADWTPYAPADQSSFDVTQHLPATPQAERVLKMVDMVEHNIRQLNMLVTASTAETQFPLRSLGHTPSATLTFPLHNLFMIGSPLAVFMALRRPTKEDTDLFNSARPRIFNVFHPADPVAYRVEPILSEKHGKVGPFLCPKCEIGITGNTGSSRGSGGLADDPSSITGVFTQMFTSTAVNESAGLQSQTSTQRTSINSNSDPGVDLIPDFTSYDMSPPLGSTLSRRIDFQLRTSADSWQPSGAVMEYWNALTSHQAYWTNPDVAFFVLSRIYDAPINNTRRSRHTNGMNNNASTMMQQQMYTNHSLSPRSAVAGYDPYQSPGPMRNSTRYGGISVSTANQSPHQSRMVTFRENVENYSITPMMSFDDQQNQMTSSSNAMYNGDINLQQQYSQQQIPQQQYNQSQQLPQSQQPNHNLSPQHQASQSQFLSQQQQPVAQFTATNYGAQQSQVNNNNQQTIQDYNTTQQNFQQTGMASPTIQQNYIAATDVNQQQQPQGTTLDLNSQQNYVASQTTDITTHQQQQASPPIQQQQSYVEPVLLQQQFLQNYSSAVTQNQPIS